jgi:hypothetical protein
VDRNILQGTVVLVALATVVVVALVRLATVVVVALVFGLHALLLGLLAGLPVCAAYERRRVRNNNYQAVDCAG